VCCLPAPCVMWSGRVGVEFALLKMERETFELPLRVSNAPEGPPPHSAPGQHAPSGQNSIDDWNGQARAVVGACMRAAAAQHDLQASKNFHPGFARSREQAREAREEQPAHQPAREKSPGAAPLRACCCPPQTDERSEPEVFFLFGFFLLPPCGSIDCDRLRRIH